MSVAAILGEEVAIVLRGDIVRLRPTLGAAMAACRLAGGFDTLMSKVDDLDTETCVGLIGAGLGRLRVEDWPWASSSELAGLRAPLLDFVALLAGGGERLNAETAAPARGGKPVGHERYLEMLFEIATGWLGWTVDAALAAPMPAILAARSGRIDLLRSVFGGQVREKNNIPLDDKVRAIMTVRGGTRIERP